MTPALTEEGVARMLREAWIADEPIPSAGSFDEIGPLMKKAWMATARAVLALVEAEREACALLVEPERFGTRECSCDGVAESVRDSIRARRTK